MSEHTQDDEEKKEKEEGKEPHDLDPKKDPKGGGFGGTIGPKPPFGPPPT
jgi:hypothetical protein